MNYNFKLIVHYTLFPYDPKILMAIFIDESCGGGRKTDDYNNENAKLKSIIRDSWLTITEIHLKTLLLRYMCMILSSTWIYLYHLWENCGSNEVFIE